MIVNDHNPNDLDRIRMLEQALHHRNAVIAELTGVTVEECVHDWKMSVGEGCVRHMYCILCDLGRPRVRPIGGSATTTNTALPTTTIQQNTTTTTEAP